MVLVDVIGHPLFSFYCQRIASPRIIICGACTRHSTGSFFFFFQANNFVIHEHFFSDLQGTLHSSHSFIHFFGSPPGQSQERPLISIVSLKSISANSHFPFDYCLCMFFIVILFQLLVMFLVAVSVLLRTPFIQEGPQFIRIEDQVRTSKFRGLYFFLLSCVTLRLPTVCINQVARLADGLHCLYCDILTIKILVYSSYSLLNHPQSRTQFSQRCEGWRVTRGLAHHITPTLVQIYGSVGLRFQVVIHSICYKRQNGLLSQGKANSSAISHLNY